MARFTFKKAFKLLQEQKEFWESFDKKDLELDEVRIDNPHRQVGDGQILAHFLIKKIKEEEKAKAKSSKKLKP